MSNSFLKKLIKSTVYKWFLNQKGSFTYYGEPVFFPKNSSTFNLAIRDGIYEQDILKFISAFVKDQSVYIDIGANIGLMSIPILKRHTTVRVLSFEASPNTFKYLKKNWGNSSVKDRWTIYNNAVSNSNDEMDFFTTASADGAYESIKDTKRVSFSGRIKVQGITIDEVWTSLNKPLVSFIKSDIEGADLMALQGALTCINECKPMIMLEWNKINILAFQFTHNDLMNFCSNIKYKCYAVPSLIVITNEKELELHAVVTENFLFIPD